MSLVLGCAVTCRERQRHISLLLSLRPALRTSLLMVLSSLQPLVTLLHLSLGVHREERGERGETEETEETEDREEKMMVTRKCSDDSGVGLEVEEEEGGLSVVVRVDVGVQHDGFFETSFDEEEDKDRGVVSVRVQDSQCQVSLADLQPERADFQSQTEEEGQSQAGLVRGMSSEVVDVDAALGEEEQEGLVNILEERVRELEGRLEEVERSRREGIRRRDGMRRREQGWRQELEAVRLALVLALQEGNNMRQEVGERVEEEEERRRRAEEAVREVERSLEAAVLSNSSLAEQSRRLVERIEELECEVRRRSRGEEALQLTLTLGGRRSLLTLGPSRASSGIGSGCITPELEWSGGEEEDGRLFSSEDDLLKSSLSARRQPGRIEELEEEAERLSSMVGVLEEREEQLLGQVEQEGAARRSAEQRARALQGGAEVGRRLKSALLLTAAFGAAHTALQSELVMECLPM